jgi:hypothetical protein
MIRVEKYGCIFDNWETAREEGKVTRNVVLLPWFIIP